MHRARHLCAQNADHLAHDSPFSAFFTEVVCVLGAAPPQAATSQPQNGGNDAIQASDTPATRRQRASHGAKPPLPPQSEATPWFAGRGLTAYGSHALQTSSIWSILKRPSTASVTNVVNLSRKTSIFNEKGVGLTTFVTTTQESPQKTPRIDDVCNKTQAGPPNRRPPRGLRGQAAVPVGGGGAWPGFETTRRSAAWPHWCGGCRRVRRARAGFEARRRTK